MLGKAPAGVRPTSGSPSSSTPAPSSILSAAQTQVAGTPASASVAAATPAAPTAVAPSSAPANPPAPAQPQPPQAAPVYPPLPEEDDAKTEEAPPVSIKADADAKADAETVVATSATTTKSVVVKDKPRRTPTHKSGESVLNAPKEASTDEKKDEKKKDGKKSPFYTTFTFWVFATIGVVLVIACLIAAVKMGENPNNTAATSSATTTGSVQAKNSPPSNTASAQTATTMGASATPPTGEPQVLDMSVESLKKYKHQDDPTHFKSKGVGYTKGDPYVCNCNSKKENADGTFDVSSCKICVLGQ